MSRPTARVLALLELLQAGGLRTVADLAGRLGVDERTVRRYVEHLIDLDIPVRSVRGRYGGYHLAPGYRMPPLMLTDEEALAVLLGLILARRERVISASAVAVESAAAKVARVLPDRLGRRWDALRSTVEVTDTPRQGGEQAAPDTQVLLTLAEATRLHSPIELGYAARDGRQSERTLHPYGIVAHGGRWYVTGADSASGQVRTFRVDRIRSAAALPGVFDVPAGFDPAGQVLDGLAEAPHRYEVSLRIHATVEHVRSRFPAGIAAVEELPEGRGRLRVRLRAERLDWVASALAMVDRPFVVDSPDELRAQLRVLAARLHAGAEDPSADATFEPDHSAKVPDHGSHRKRDAGPGRRALPENSSAARCRAGDSGY